MSGSGFEGAVTSVVVCVGWRPGNPVREANWDIARQHYLDMGLDVISEDSDSSKPFNLPQAINRAVAAAGPDWDVVIIPDADTMLSHDAAVEATFVAATTGCLVCPVERYWQQAENGEWPGMPKLRWPGGVHVWGQTAFRVLGGYDERFTGWSSHHEAAVDAAFAFGLLRSVSGDAYHLYHPHPAREAARAAGRDKWVGAIVAAHESAPPGWERDEASWFVGLKDWLDGAEEFGDSPPEGYGGPWPPPNGWLIHPLALRYMRAQDDPVAMRALLVEADAERSR